MRCSGLRAAQTIIHIRAALLAIAVFIQAVRPQLEVHVRAIAEDEIREEFHDAANWLASK